MADFNDKDIFFQRLKAQGYTVETLAKIMSEQMPVGTFDPTSGGAVWGQITGTLSTQTDLQNALDNAGGIPTTTLADLATWAGRFDRNYIVGTESSPTSGNITYDFTGAVIGAKVTIFHNSASNPTFPATSRFISGEYIRSLNNKIDLYYESASIVYVVISQPTSTLIPSLVPYPYQSITSTIFPFGNVVTFGSATSVASGDSILGAYEAFTIAAVNEAKGRQSSSSSFIKADATNWVASFNFRVNLLSNGTDRFIHFAGLSTSQTTPYSQNDSVGVIYSDDINAGKFQLRIAKTSGDNNTEDLGVTVTAGGVYEIFMQNELGVGLKVWINGVLTGTYATTNMPDGLVRNMVVVTKTVGTTSIQPIDNGSMNLGI